MQSTSFYHYYLHNKYSEQYIVPETKEQETEVRKLAAAMFPCRLLAGAADTCIGGIAGLISACTGGLFLTDLAHIHLSASANTVSDLFFFSISSH